MSICAFDRDGECVALNTKQCVGYRFNKTEWELKEGRKKATERILSLPKATHIRIARKYYDRGSQNG